MGLEMWNKNPEQDWGTWLKVKQTKVAAKGGQAADGKMSPELKKELCCDHWTDLVQAGKKKGKDIDGDDTPEELKELPKWLRRSEENHHRDDFLEQCDKTPCKHVKRDSDEWNDEEKWKLKMSLAFTKDGNWQTATKDTCCHEWKTKPQDYYLPDWLTAHGKKGKKKAEDGSEEVVVSEEVVGSDQFYQNIKDHVQAACKKPQCMEELEMWNKNPEQDWGTWLKVKQTKVAAKGGQAADGKMSPELKKELCCDHWTDLVQAGKKKGKDIDGDDTPEELKELPKWLRRSEENHHRDDFLEQCDKTPCKHVKRDGDEWNDEEKWKLKMSLAFTKDG